MPKLRVGVQPAVVQRRCLIQKKYIKLEPMPNDRNAHNDPDPVLELSRVTTLELFFDLVFVFTLTQLTALLSKSLSWERLLQSFLIFIILFWMYGGYVW